MEISVKQTQCPFCHSVFYITTLQLQSYHGHARCGQCQQVFDAAANLIAQPSSDNPTTSVATPTQAAIDSAELTTVHLGDVFDSDFLDQQLIAPKPGANAVQAIPEAQKTADAQRLEAEDLVEKILAVQPHTSQKPLTADGTTQQQNTNVMSEHEETLLGYLKQSGVASAQTPAINRDAFREKPAQHRILQATRQRKNNAGTIGWGILSLLMLVLLAAQYIYFNFEKLTYNAATRPYMTSLCQAIGCSLPYMNADEIQLQHVSLLSNVANQTTFTATLVNQSSLSQPFPALKLVLLRQGKIIAGEILQPREYLPEQSQTLSRLPSHTPYQIMFTIDRSTSAFEQFALSPEFK